MNTYKTLINKGIPNATLRANPNNLQIGDIVAFTMNKKINYAYVISFSGNTSIRIKDLFLVDNKYFMTDDNHDEQNSSHKGLLNYNYLIPKSKARNVKIVDSPIYE